MLVLLALEAEALLPTITSRCQTIALRPIPRTVIEKSLIRRWQVPADQAELLSHICGGRLGWAVSAAHEPAVLEERVRRLDDLVRLLHSRRAARFAYAESFARQAPEAVLDQLELWTSWWRDMMLLQNDSSVPLTNVDRRRELSDLAHRCSLSTATSALTQLQDTMVQIQKNTNTRLALEVLFLDLPFLV
jgi:DNA polymerase-3 subunit delta'